MEIFCGDTREPAPMSPSCWDTLRSFHQGKTKRQRTAEHDPFSQGSRPFSYEAVELDDKQASSKKWGSDSVSEARSVARSLDPKYAPVTVFHRVHRDLAKQYRQALHISESFPARKDKEMPDMLLFRHDVYDLEAVVREGMRGFKGVLEADEDYVRGILYPFASSLTNSNTSRRCQLIHANPAHQSFGKQMLPVDAPKSAMEASGMLHFPHSLVPFVLGRVKKMLESKADEALSHRMDQVEREEAERQAKETESAQAKEKQEKEIARCSEALELMLHAVSWETIASTGVTIYSLQEFTKNLSYVSTDVRLKMNQAGVVFIGDYHPFTPKLRDCTIRRSDLPAVLKYCGKDKKSRQVGIFLLDWEVSCAYEGFFQGGIESFSRGWSDAYREGAQDRIWCNTEFTSRRVFVSERVHMHVLDVIRGVGICDTIPGSMAALRLFLEAYGEELKRHMVSATIEFRCGQGMDRDKSVEVWLVPRSGLGDLMDVLDRGVDPGPRSNSL